MGSSRTAAHGEVSLTRRVRLFVPAAALTVVVLVVVGYAVLPTRSWLAQRGEIDQLESDIAAMEESNAALQARAESLKTLVEVERIARADLGLVRPGEEVYAVLPAAPEPVRIPPSWPFSALGVALLDS